MRCKKNFSFLTREQLFAKPLKIIPTPYSFGWTMTYTVLCILFGQFFFNTTLKMRPPLKPTTKCCCIYEVDHLFCVLIVYYNSSIVAIFLNTQRLALPADARPAAARERCLGGVRSVDGDVPEQGPERGGLSQLHYGATELRQPVVRVRHERVQSALLVATGN